MPFFPIKSIEGKPLFSHHPALYYGIVAVATSWFPWLGTLAALLSPRRMRLGCCFGLALSLYITLFYPKPPPLPSSGIQGTACITFSRIRLCEHAFGSQWVIDTQLHSFQGEGYMLQNYPCTIYLPKKNYPNWEHLPSPHSQHQVEGKLRSSPSGHFLLKTSSETVWLPTKKRCSLLSWRYHSRERLLSWIETHYQNPTVAHLFYGLVSGEIVDRPLEDVFKRLGMLHLLAISGLHFSLLAAFLSTAGQLVLPYRWSLLASCAILLVYFCFLGNSPSVLRAAIMSSISLLAVWIERPSTSLNSLGAAMLIATLWDPLSTRTLGFHLSYGITASILLLYPFAENALASLIPPRPMKDVLHMPLLDQHSYLVLSFFRESLALGGSVHCFSIPYLLFQTKKIPLASIFFNLFVPTLLSLSLLVFLLECTLAWIPFLSHALAWLNGVYTEWVLSLLFAFPIEWE